MSIDMLIDLFSNDYIGCFSLNGIMIFDKEQLKQEIKDFLGQDRLDYLNECNKNGTFFIAFGSCLGGNVGMQIRNHLRDIHPELNEYSISKFEDESAILTLELLEN